MTEAETKLWHALRRRLPSHRFRRQVPIGDYIADFCCLAMRLIIEVDGNQHGFDKQRAKDESRTAMLECSGFRVIRFANEDVFRELDSVIDTIFYRLAEPTDDSDQRGGSAPRHRQNGNVALDMD